MVIDVTRMGMVEPAGVTVVSVITMRNGRVSVAGRMLVSAGGKLRHMAGLTDADHMLVDMAVMSTVKVAVVQVIRIAVMGDRIVTAVSGMCVSMRCMDTSHRGSSAESCAGNDEQAGSHGVHPFEQPRPAAPHPAPKSSVLSSYVDTLLCQYPA